MTSSSDALKRIATQRITVDPEKCLGEGTCVRVCPFMVFKIEQVNKGKKKRAVPVHQEDCFLCQSCQAQCPTDAITIEW